MRSFPFILYLISLLTISTNNRVPHKLIYFSVTLSLLNPNILFLQHFAFSTLNICFSLKERTVDDIQFVFPLLL
jgi:hypothetical protein